VFEELMSKAVARRKPWWHYGFPLGTDAMSRYARILDYLYSEEVKDYEETHFERAHMRSPDFDEFYSTRPEFDDLRTRFLARITSYVITACNLDGVLKTSYRKMLSDLGDLGYQDRLPSDKGAVLMQERRAEIRSYSVIRNKIFAHTSFADPKGDSESMQFTALRFASGMMITYTMTCLSVGGASSPVSDKDKIDLPSVSVVGGHPAMIQHCKQWENMFVSILDQIPAEELATRIDTLS